MECLVKEGFDPNAALFKATSDNRLYPNPAAQALVPNALGHSLCHHVASSCFIAAQQYSYKLIVFQLGKCIL